MNLISYPARFWFEDDVWYAQFPRLGGTTEGLLTYGETREEAHEMARECLTGYILSAHQRGVLEAPRGLSIGETPITPALPVAVALTLRHARRVNGLTLSEAADLVGLSEADYARQEDVEGSARWDTLERLASTLGDRVQIQKAAPLVPLNKKSGGYTNKSGGPTRQSNAGTWSRRPLANRYVADSLSDESRRRFRASSSGENPPPT